MLKFKRLLLNLDKFHLSQLCVRNLSSKNAKNQEARFMMKIMKGSKNPRLKVLKQLEVEQKNSLIFAGMQNSFSVKSTSSSGKINSRRKEILNSLFSRYIADHISTSSLQGFDIQITNVDVTPDLGLVKVHWISRSCLTGYDGSLQMELDKYSVRVRKDLSNLRIIGTVPPIMFVPDKILAQGAAVDQLLRTAEMSEEAPAVESEDDFLPPMRQDVLGLDREKIMAKIARKSMKQSLPQDSSNRSEHGEASTLEEMNSAIEEFKKLRNKSLKEKKIREKSLRSTDYDLLIDRSINEEVEIEQHFEDQDFIDDDDSRK